MTPAERNNKLLEDQNRISKGLSWATLASATFIFIGLILNAVSLDSTNHSHKAQMEIEVIKIQKELRDIYLNYKLELDKLEIEKYHSDGGKYSENQRRIIRRYWTDIVFNEYLITKEFGNSDLNNRWEQAYTFWVGYSLHENNALAEEWCFIFDSGSDKSPEKNYFGAFGDDYQQALEKAYVKYIRENYSSEAQSTEPKIHCDMHLSRRKASTIL